ncbi:histidine phosphatase family protein [Sulfitobacter mediterraneus]|uniref:histidine phosphatase family protein n=1 Tax=Sulfitobacter mediterraneus TaxID=83219 RepID=UPI0019394FE8|nr:histidine phosphatase family protein [Sulfitobacter mediterraneus]MBM1558627.1 histidine phosphatase family protein [Sulfitobacter mediterraneus]MBM1569991.1 histidine phosphatase family protein [Sulfitobacter mediterraneus]MBM1573947.1 histidine phosphatase family protein [Sulfitobacter mediterraneus]MBM1577721.1 histidine phosphatase family protein [Sulfitobacter mediterraneus]MBM1581608.1 histidine phosphatase family protein [Sulfitobacter mediterraneus]
MSNEMRQHRFTAPKGAADLILIRHGETQAAVRGQNFPMVGGQGDPALRPEGHAQAEAVGARLRDHPIDAIYVTTMQRTHQTAAPLAAHLGLTPRVEADLREVFLGDWDGGEFRFRAAEGDPAILRARERHEWGELPGAETTAAFQTRVRRGLLRIAAAHADELVAVVVHGGVVGAALALATGAKAFSFSGAANGSISRLVVHGEEMIVRGFNDCAHL